jgi:hypothetical protein
MFAFECLSVANWFKGARVHGRRADAASGAVNGPAVDQVVTAGAWFSTCDNSRMEREQLDYTIVMENGPHSEMLGRVRDLDFGAAVFTAAVAKFTKRNIQLELGERIIKRHEGELPKPKPMPVDPNLKTWSVHVIGGRKAQQLGYVQAASEVFCFLREEDASQCQTLLTIAAMSCLPRWLARVNFFPGVYANP